MLSVLLCITPFLVIGTRGESLFSVACSQTDQQCVLFKIDIDHTSDRAISNEITRWSQANIGDHFGSVAGFQNGNSLYIVMTNNCDGQAYLINITDLSHPPPALLMKTSCTQPMYPIANRYLLALGTEPNHVGGSSPVSLYAFDGISGHFTQGRHFPVVQASYLLA